MPEYGESVVKKGWLSPLNKISFFHAFKNKLRVVKISDGRIFDLDYGKRPDEVYVKVRGDFIPQGYFNLKKVTAPLWLEQQD